MPGHPHGARGGQRVLASPNTAGGDTPASAIVRQVARLSGGGERIVRVPRTLMAHARDAARSYGKSDRLDALAVACAHYVNLTCPGLIWTARHVRCVYWWIIGRAWSGPDPGSWTR